MQNFATCHCHIQSLDSASTPEAFVERELELGTGVLTCTDHGTLVACRKVYDLAKAKSLTPVLGLEGYLRDDNCSILARAGYQKNANGAFIGAPKYMHVTLHFLDQNAYECGVRLLSAADARLEETLAKLEPDDRRHGRERKPLFTWNDLEELGGHNVTMTTGCLIGVVQRHILDNNDGDTARRYYQRLKSCVKPGNLYVEVFPHDCSKNWIEGVFIDVKGDDGQDYSYRWYAGKTVMTDHSDKSNGIKVDALAKAFANKNNEHKRLVAVKNYRKWEEVPPGEIRSVRHIAEFAPNECRDWAPDGDVQAGLNRMMRGFAKKFGDKILIGDDSHYAHPDEKVVQDVRLSQGGDSWRFYGSYHRQSSEEAFSYFQAKINVGPAEFEGWVNNSHEWAGRFKDFKFHTEPSLPTKFYEAKYPDFEWHSNPKVETRDHSLRYTMELVKKHGRMDWTNKIYVDRLATEIKLLHNNGTLDLLPYFFLDEEVCSLYESKGMLTGPGRGSAAGLLLTYLLGITHVDPIRYGLSLERFITLDRIKSGKLPDIDQDLPSRDLLVDPETGWLKERFGDHYAQISVDSTLKLKMAVKDVARALRDDHTVPDDVESMTKKFEMPPQGVNDLDFVLGYDTDEGHTQGSIERDPVLQEYIKKYPKHWEVVQKCLGLSRQKGRHACAFVVANRPIHEFIPLTTVSDVRVTSYTAPSVEAVGGLKMDFLVINSLNDIGDAIRLIQERSGMEIPKETKIGGRRVPGHRLLPVDGKLYDIWDLPEDQAVFGDVATGKTETVFQFNTPGAIQWLEHFGHQKSPGVYAIDSIESMSAFTALDRPGPLDIDVKDPDDKDGGEHNMLVEYARRARGATPSPDVLQVFNDLLPETFGVMVYQEQLQRVYQQLTGCTGAEAEEFRSDVAKKKKSKIDKAYTPFIQKASLKIGKENAEAAWQFFVTWAKYGFNKSHAVCYSVIGYACAYLKHHYPLEWWTAVLKNAAKNEVNDKFWRHCGHLIDLPDVKLSGAAFEIQNERIRAPLSLLHGVGEAAHAQLCKYAPYTDIQDFCDKIERHKQETGEWTRKVKKVKEKIPNPDTTNKRRKTINVDVQKEVDHFQKGYNALNSKIVNTLIFSGAMDSLFPASRTITDDKGQEITVPTTVADHLAMYEEASARAGKKKKAKPVDPKYLAVGPLQRYQMRKGILPAYGEDLVPILLGLEIPNIHKEKDGSYLDWMPPNANLEEPLALKIVDCHSYAKMAVKTYEKTDTIQVAVAAYIDDVRPFQYGSERKSACELVLDIEGDKFKLVKWAGRDKKLPPIYEAALKGSVVVAVLSKWSADRPFNIDDIVEVQSPWKDTKEEEKDTDE